MQQRLSIITLGVRDLNRAKAFYLDGLGWKSANSSNDNIIFMQLNGIALALYAHDTLAKDACIHADRSEFRGFTLAYNAENEQEVGHTLALAEKAGATITKKPQKVFWGGYSGYFKDLDGFLWEVAYDPLCKLTDMGDIILD